jgi:putative aminopeptidase FrvX
MPPTSLSDAQRADHLAWLLELTQIPSASGREFRVVRWIERWAAARPDIALERDSAGNMTLSLRSRPKGHENRRPVYFTAHLDHPAFVVERILAPGVVELSFRGGVMDEYFKQSKVVICTASDVRILAVLTGEATDAGPPAGPFKHYLAECSLSDAAARAAAGSIAVGDVAVWDLPPAEVIDGKMYTLACDDLAAAAAALAAFDVLREKAATQPIEDVRLLFTLAEEIGFVGAIAAAKGLSRDGSPTPAPTIPRNARVIALENSRSFPESPIHGGPIVRVGDRLSIFSPTLTDAVAKRAEEYASQFGTSGAQPTAQQKLSDGPKWKWQRKLMAGGACEASVFCHAGFEATCVCLALGNYHNMGDLANVQAGTNTTPPKIEREFIGVDDFEGLVDLLIACGERLPEVGYSPDRFDKLWNERNFVLR